MLGRKFDKWCQEYVETHDHHFPSIRCAFDAGWTAALASQREPMECGHPKAFWIEAEPSTSERKTLHCAVCFAVAAALESQREEVEELRKKLNDSEAYRHELQERLEDKAEANASIIRDHTRFVAAAYAKGASDYRKAILDKKRDLYEVGSEKSEGIQFVVNCLPIPAAQPRDSEIETVVRIMCEAQSGAALNAVVEDYPELWEHISKLKYTAAPQPRDLGRLWELEKKWKLDRSVLMPGSDCRTSLECADELAAILKELEGSR